MKKIGLGLIAISLGLFLSGCGNKYNGYALHSVKFYEKHPKQAEAILTTCAKETKNMTFKEAKTYMGSNLAKDCNNVEMASLNIGFGLATGK